jgi:hypothetical protein
VTFGWLENADPFTFRDREQMSVVTEVQEAVVQRLTEFFLALICSQLPELQTPVVDA